MAVLPKTVFPCEVSKSLQGGGGGSMLQSGTKEMFSNVTQTTKLMSINRVEKDYVGTLVKK